MAALKFDNSNKGSWDVMRKKTHTVYQVSKQYKRDLWSLQIQHINGCDINKNSKEENDNFKVLT